MLKGHKAAVLCVYESPEEHLLATGSEDRSVRLWDVRTCTSVRRLGGFDAGVNCVRKGEHQGEWFAGCGNVVLRFDLRNETRLLVNSHSGRLSTRYMFKLIA
jgi:WD40 repeat protein